MNETSNVALKLREHSDLPLTAHDAPEGSGEHKPYEGLAVPMNYDRYLVPLIFEAYAADLVERANVPAGGTVLETACGTGVVTRHLIDRLPEGIHLTATDLSAQMVEYARYEVDGPDVVFQQADALALPFPDGSFDAVICQFGAMLYPDVVKGHREAARVLKPQGQYLFNVWESLERNGFSKVVHEAVGRLYPDNPPRFLESPFHYNDLAKIVNDLRTAGFTDIDISVLPLESHAPQAEHVAWGLVAGSPLAAQVVERGTLTLDEAVEAVTEAVTKQYGPGPIMAPMQAIQISAH